MLISHASKVILQIVQARLQQYMNWEIPDVQAAFRKGKETRDQTANIHWIIQKAREFQKKSTSASLTTIKPLCGSQQTGKFLEMGIPDHLICLLRNLYTSQEATVRTGHGTTNWFKIGKGVCQGYILSPCLFNLYVECIIWNARLDESQAWIKTVGRNINKLRYADDTILLAEREEELKTLDQSERG